MSYLAMLLLLGTRAVGVLDPGTTNPGTVSSLHHVRLPDPPRAALRFDPDSNRRPVAESSATALSKIRPWVVIEGGLDRGRDGFAFAAGAGFVFD